MSKPKWQIPLFPSFLSLPSFFPPDFLPALFSFHPSIYSATYLPFLSSPCTLPKKKLKYWFLIPEFSDLYNLVLVRITSCFKISVTFLGRFPHCFLNLIYTFLSQLLPPLYPCLVISTLIFCHCSPQWSILPDQMVVNIYRTLTLWQLLLWEHHPYLLTVPSIQWGCVVVMCVLLKEKMEAWDVGGRCRGS